MKERFFVASISKTNPELVAVNWFKNKADAVEEIHRRNDFYFMENHILAKVLNVPSFAEKKCPHCGADVLVTHYGSKWYKCPVCGKSLKPNKEREKFERWLTGWEKNINGEKQR